ncbi:DUF4091 domain-containing protein [Candidatus Venteria ishoeyi]|uniref:Glycoside hydrolase 123 catalytic domain-containing protein n=1 Tax=Candidatus Venteria ishoeyi TaxID=1899563 RepID=A0A1H6FCB9_9GAMM|nr:glycoside hydrolase domain-containing protein [Candidatus Venteria ishoeyi]SEH07730.1 Uncharacterised protein [Candidatus Venteria ishoeyi]
MFLKNIVLSFLLLLLHSLATTQAFAQTPTQTPAQTLENFSYRLTESTQQQLLWTTPPSERVFKDSVVPETTASGIRLYAAKNEFEPFLLVIQVPQDSTLNIQLPDFGHGILSTLHQVHYVNIQQATDNLGRIGPYPDPLLPLSNPAQLSLKAGENMPLWFTLQVPPTTPAGDYSATVTLGNITVPVSLHVFNFAIPETLHVHSQMNFSHQAVLEKYGVPGTGDEYWRYVLAMKQFFLAHRLTPKSALWPGGVTGSGAAPFIDYDCVTQSFSDPHGIWGFEIPASVFLQGVDWFNSGTGFPEFMAATFRNNDASQDQRPDEFCGHSRSANDWYTANNPNTAYNQAWFAYIRALQNYLSGLGLLDKAHYYFANEPQDQADHDAVAWYARLLKQAAPDLKIMVSEEARSEIYANPTYGAANIDIWLPVLNNYDPDIARQRALEHQEESWIYFLHGTRPPYFNPITLDHPGIESKLTGWFLWKYRIRGIAYYALNQWSRNPWTDPMTDGHNGDTFMLYPPSADNQAISYGATEHRFASSIRFELMRDSLEDYEYLYVLNGHSQPEHNQATPADTQADKIIQGLTSYNRDSEFIYNLRRVIGLKNGGEISEIPDLTPVAGHPRAQGAPGNYYLNFQDPAAEPLAEPLVVDNKTYLKIGWNAYDEQLGYGWFGDLAHVMSRYVDSAPNPLQASILFDDWGRQKSFEFDLPNGSYNVTVSTGWQGRTYKRNYINIEGVDFINDEATDPYLLRTREVSVQDGKLSMAMGIFDEYTMLNYMDIETLAPVNSKPVLNIQIQDEAQCAPDYQWLVGY